MAHYPWITPWNVYDVEWGLLQVLVNQVLPNSDWSEDA